MAVITIARESGTGGLDVATRVAEALGARVVDRFVIDEVARRASLSPDEVAADDEHASSLLGSTLRAALPLSGTFPAWPGAPDQLVDHHPQIVAFTRAVIEEAMRLGNAVILGRGGAALLHGRPGTVHVFLWAPPADRVRVIAERLGCDAARARREMDAVDARREAYVHEVYGVHRGDRELYDLILNTARLGPAGAAAAILAAAQVTSNARSPDRRTAAAGPLR